MRILAVDDDASSLLMLANVLRFGGHDVTACETPQQARDLFTECPEAFDLVITDYQMPAMTGIEVEEAIRAASPDTPVILMSGVLDLGPLTREGFRNNRSVIAKPIDPQRLHALLAQVSQQNAADAASPG